MKISELPPALRELAGKYREKHVKNHGGIYDPEEDYNLSSAFIWSDTDEGGKFWDAISGGTIPEEYRLPIELKPIIDYQIY